MIRCSVGETSEGWVAITVDKGNMTNDDAWLPACVWCCGSSPVWKYPTHGLPLHIFRGGM